MVVSFARRCGGGPNVGSAVRSPLVLHNGLRSASRISSVEPTCRAEPPLQHPTLAQRELTCIKASSAGNRNIVTLDGREGSGNAKLKRQTATLSKLPASGGRQDIPPVRRDRPRRFAVEYAKVEQALRKACVCSTVVVFGSVRIPSPEQAGRFGSP